MNEEKHEGIEQIEFNPLSQDQIIISFAFPNKNLYIYNMKKDRIEKTIILDGYKDGLINYS